MNIPDFPQFDIPEMEPKAISSDVYAAWNEENVIRLTKAGHRERWRNDVLRVPVADRFVLE